MNYQQIYDSIIAAAQAAQPSGYTEKHHIIPRCIGGSDEPENLVPLTARQHFIAHLLLAKIHGGALVHAAFRMSKRWKYTSRKYEWLRVAHAEKISQMMKGNKHNIGRKLSAEHIAALRRGHARTKGRKFTPEHCARISKALKGRKLTPEQCANIAKAQTGAKRSGRSQSKNVPCANGGIKKLSVTIMRERQNIERKSPPRCGGKNAVNIRPKELPKPRKGVLKLVDGRSPQRPEQKYQKP